jgi:hypothetical protein
MTPSSASSIRSSVTMSRKFPPLATLLCRTCVDARHEAGESKMEVPLARTSRHRYTHYVALGVDVHCLLITRTLSCDRRATPSSFRLVLVGVLD